MEAEKILEKTQEVAMQLTQARCNKAPVAQWSQSGVTISRAEAYQIQRLGVEHRLQQGEIRIGFKMGLTSEGKRKQMNLDTPLYGELTQKMQIENNSAFDMSSLIHPKIEPEIAFKIKNTITGRLTKEEALKNITHIAAGMEILDSRYQQFKYFSMEDVIADNSSSSHFILGSWVPFESPRQWEKSRLELYMDGKLVQSGEAKEISGDPIQSIVELSNLLTQNQRILEAGSIVLAGAATAAVELKPGQNFKMQVHSPFGGITSDSEWEWPLVKLQIEGSLKSNPKEGN